MLAQWKMRIDVSTGSFREAATRAARVVHECEWWAVEARVALALVAPGALPQVEHMRRVAGQLEQLARHLALLAQRYDDHEAATSRMLAPFAAGALVVTALGALPYELAAVVALTGITRNFAETNVSTRMTHTQEAAVQSGVEELLSRIPQGDDQVRIDAIESAGRTRYVVYISGTRDFGVIAGDQPWDMTSNVNALRGDSSGCERAVRQAMSEAGIGPRDQVVLVGHSLGGLVATRLAQSGDYAVSDVVTVGAPIRSTAIPSQAKFTQLEYTNDVVPAITGIAVATGAVTVRARYSGPASSSPFGPHDLSSYRSMAREIDRSDDDVLRKRGAELRARTQGVRVTSHWYRSVRN